ncbi:MAG: CHAD domain-containing protein [Pseudomonadota bacterium]
MTLTSRTAHASHQEQARAILLQLSGQARRAREAFLVSASVENVHALRGALRRAADGVGLLEGCLLASDVAWLRRELRWQARRLGKTRDLDVLSARLVAKHPYTGEFRPADLLIASARTRRDAVVETAKAQLLSARAATLADRLEHVLLRALEAGEGRLHFDNVISSWLSQADSAIRVGEKRVMALGRRGRHKLRGHIRTLRYNCEVCSNGSPAETRYIAAVIVLQTALGEMNDDAVCASLRKELAHCGDLDKVPGLEPSLHQIHRRELKRAWRALDVLALPDFAQAQHSRPPGSSPGLVSAAQPPASAS